MVSLVITADLPAASTTSASTSAANSSGGINTTRPPSSQQASASASTASSASQPAPTVINLTGKKRWTMHDELHSILPDAVYRLYTALDSNAHLSADKRFKLQEACKKSSTSALYDPAIGAPFGHQLQLSLADGAHFDSVKRGLALAIAGRSAGLETLASGSLVRSITRYLCIRKSIRPRSKTVRNLVLMINLSRRLS
jgi:hypothetical protein